MTALRERVKSSRPLRILFVGNSYTKDLIGAFDQLAETRGKAVQAGGCWSDGWMLLQHARHPETLAQIRSGSWDVVVLQEQSRLPTFPDKRKRLMIPAVVKLANEARLHGAIPILYRTWGRQHGDEHLANDNFFAMNERLRQGYREASRQAGGLAIVPVGDFWEAAIRAGRGNQIFYQDGSHPSAQGNQLSAQAFFETLYGEPKGQVR